MRVAEPRVLETEGSPIAVYGDWSRSPTAIYRGWSLGPQRTGRMPVTLKITECFFDSDKVQRAVDRATRRVLSKAGAYIRTRAKSSIRKRKKVSPAGKPPHSHRGDLRRLIYFAYDPAMRSVIVGPVRFKHGGAAALEHGGQAVIEAGGRRGTRRRRRVYIRRRPFMGPAMEKELPNFPQLWHNSVR